MTHEKNENKTGRLKKWLPHLTLRNCLMISLGNIILAFGLYQIHAQTHVGEFLPAYEHYRTSGYCG